MLTGRPDRVNGPVSGTLRLSSPGVTPRARVTAIVAAAAAAAAAATVGVTLATADRPEREAARPRAGAPPLELDLGVRLDREARDLRRAQILYARGRRGAAAEIFARYDSLEARIGGAFAAWPSGTLERVERLAAAAPERAVAQLHLGFALFWLRRTPEAIVAWRRAVRVEPDSASAVRADDLLHPRFARGLPTFLSGFRPPAALTRLSPPRQLEYLARLARRGFRGRLLYGVALQRLGKPLSARRQYDAAAELAPASPDAQVAAAVGRFEKAAPARAFSRLGPLARRFPKAATVRFHLGLLLLWIGRVEEAKAQLRRATELGPETAPGREAKRLLDRIRRL